MSNGNIFADIGAAIEADVQTVVTDIKQFWTTEEPIIVGELKTAAQQLSSIVVAELLAVLQQVSTGAVQSTEAFGTLVTNAYQTAAATGLSVAITDVQQAAAQAYSAAKTAVAAAATPPAPAPAPAP